MDTVDVAERLCWSKADVWDFETTGLYWWRDQPYALAVLIDGSPYVFAFDALPLAMSRMQDAAEQPGHTLIAYNAKFDLHFASRSGMRVLPENILDPSVALFLIDENRFSGSGRGGLKSAVKELFGHQMREFEEVLGRISEETGELRTRKCKLCYGKGWRGRAHDPCAQCSGLGLEQTPVTRTRQRRIDEVPLDELARYAGEDVWWTKRVWEWCEQQLANYSLLRSNFYEVQMPLLVALYQAEHRGIRVDRENAVVLRETYLQRIAAIDERIWHTAGVRVEGATAVDEDDERDDPAGPADIGTGTDALRVNLNAPGQTDWFLYEFLGLKRPPFRAKRKAKDGSRVESKWQTDETCLLWLAKNGNHEVPKLLWERRKCAKYVGTYLDNILTNAVGISTPIKSSPRRSEPSTTAVEATAESDVWILYPNFNQTSAKTGRLSSSKPLNFQNIPRLKEFRSLFIARPGKKLVIADAKQIELRFLAHFSNEPELVDAYRDPTRDLHQETADNLKLEGKEGRYVAKTANFAEVYEVFGTTLAMQLFRDTEGAIDWTPQQAQAVLDGIRERRQGVKRWKQHVVATLKEQGYVRTIDKRRRRLPGIKDPNWGLQKYAERQGINACIQGSVADLFARLLTNPLVSATLLLQVHDEVVCEVDAAQAASFASQIQEAIEAFTALYQTRVPILADVGVGDDWSSKA